MHGEDNLTFIYSNNSEFCHIVSVTELKVITGNVICWYLLCSELAKTTDIDPWICLLSNKRTQERLNS